jgi:hypothetical protein
MNPSDVYGPKTATELGQVHDFAFDLANRYGTRVERYEAYNEPNLTDFWQPAANPNEYAAFLRSFYLGAKSANAGVTVTFGGISQNDVGFLRATYAALKSYPDAPVNNNFFDELGLHPYSF